ncbi:aspartate aminotransferase family protein [Acidisoma sp. 7E03]
MPLGVTDNYQYWGEDTLVIRRGKGGTLWDVDDNRYEDFRLSYGPIILGYQDHRVDDHVKEALDNGVLFGLPTPRTLVVAELLQSLVHGLETVRFANSGSDAVMATLRLARAFTGREELVLIEGAFHGLFDWVMWEALVEDYTPGEGVAPPIRARGGGIPSAIRDRLHFIPFNDAGALREVLRENPGKVSAVLLEPILGNSCAISPTAEYLRDVRGICDEFDVVLIFDEVKTGFRVGRGGASELYGVTPDLWAFSKALGNGYPIAAFGGRRDIMSWLHPFDGGVVHGGTYTGNAVGLAAAEATLEVIKRTSALDTVEEFGRSLQNGLHTILNRLGVSHQFTGHLSMFGVMFCDEPLRSYRDWRMVDNCLYQRWAAQLRELGVLIEPDSREPWFFCEAHSHLDLGNVLDRIEAASLKSFKR